MLEVDLAGVAESVHPPGEQPICSWTEGSRQFAIHLRPDVIGRLGIEAWMAFKKVPRRGLEIGGVLLGRVNAAEETTTFWVEGFQPVESEHRSGPSYLLSESDLSDLRQEVERSELKSIGIFRSHTRSEQVGATQADAEMFERCFDAKSALFLLLGPAPGLAAFFVRTDGNFRRVHELALASSLAAIMKLQQGRPFAKGKPAAASPQITPSALSAPSVVSPLDPSDTGHSLTACEQSMDRQRADRQQRFIPEQERVVSSARWGWWVPTAITFLVAGATASSFSYSFRRSAAPNPQAPQALHLSVQPAGMSLRLQWDPNASAVRGAARAILHVQDGDLQSDRDLASQEFAAGSLAYQPKNADVTFRLDVYSAEPNATGFIQVMNIPLQHPIPLAASSGPPSVKPFLPPVEAAAFGKSVQPAPVVSAGQTQDDPGDYRSVSGLAARIPPLH
jgi:hypothetical protein